MRIVLALVLILFCLPRQGEAACDTSADPILVAADASRTEVAACVTAASNTGDTIQVPAGSSTWGSRIALGSKSITITGAGAGSTVITSGGFQIGVDCTSAVNSTSISGFTFLWSSDNATLHTIGARGWRFHHNTVTYTSASDGFTGFGCPDGGGRVLEGLIDHNTITYGSLVWNGTAGPGTTYGAGNQPWASSLSWGTDRYIYIEDNTIIWTEGDGIDGGGVGGYLRAIDGNRGYRVVARFNSVQNGRFEVHGLQGINSRGGRAWEFYNNTFTNTANPSFREWLVRAGTGLIFHNTTDAGALNDNIYIDNPRTGENSILGQMGAWEFCDDTPGTPAEIDAQESGGEGYLCRDQIGASTDAFDWNLYSGTPPTQSKQPAYIFRNIVGASTEQIVSLNCPECTGDQATRQSTKHLVEDRDWFTYDAAFDGSSGVGEGARGSRPMSGTTTNVAYWSTNAGGNWNTINGTSDDGCLDVWNGSSWTNCYYTPYTYPHPLQGVSGADERRMRGPRFRGMFDGVPFLVAPFVFVAVRRLRRRIH